MQRFIRNLDQQAGSLNQADDLTALLLGIRSESAEQTDGDVLRFEDHSETKAASA